MTIPWRPAPLYVGRHRAPKATPQPAPLSPVEIECEALQTVLRHLMDGRSVDDAWRLGEIDAADLRLRNAVVMAR